MVCMLLFFFLFKDSFPSKYFILFFNELIKNTDKKRALSFLKENKNTVNQRAHYICVKCFSEGMKFLMSVLKTANTISNNFHAYGNDTRNLILFRFFVCDPHHKGLDLYLRAACAWSPVISHVYAKRSSEYWPTFAIYVFLFKYIYVYVTYICNVCFFYFHCQILVYLSLAIYFEKRYRYSE